MLKIKFLILFITLTMLIGCAHQVKIYIDGYPLSEREYSVQSNNLSARYYLSRWYKRNLGNKEYELYPEHLRKGRTYSFPKDTKKVAFHVMVVNPGNKYYQIVYNIKHYTDKTINRSDLLVAYKGRKTQNMVDVVIDTTIGMKAYLTVYLANAKGLKVIDLGDVSFEIKDDTYISR